MDKSLILAIYEASLPYVRRKVEVLERARPRFVIARGTHAVAYSEETLAALEAIERERQAAESQVVAKFKKQHGPVLVEKRK